MNPEPPMRLAWIEQPETPKERRHRRVRTVFSFRAIREIALTLGAVAGVLCLLSGAATVAFDVKPVIFRSGSMSPAIETGALAFSRTVDASELAVGDVVTVPSGTGERITHRIQSVSVVDGKANLVLRGDANTVADDRVYVVKSAPRVLFDIPKAGYVVSFATGPIGIFAGGLLVGVVLLMIFRPGAPKPRKNPGGARRLYFAATALSVGVAAAGSVGATTNTMAYYTDTAVVTSGTFTRAPAPCTYANGVVRIQIPQVSGATGYKVRVSLGILTLRNYTVGPDGVVEIDVSGLAVGSFLISSTSIGGGGVKTNLASFTIVQIPPLISIGALVCLGVDIPIGNNTVARVAPTADSGSSAVVPDTDPATPDTSTPEVAPDPTPEPAPDPAPDPAPATEPPAADVTP